MMYVAGKLPQWQLAKRLAWVLAREFELATNGYLECVDPNVEHQVGQALHEYVSSLLVDDLLNALKGQDRNLYGIVNNSMRQLEQLVDAFLDGLRPPPLIN